MKYKIKQKLSHNAADCIEELLFSRGINDVNEYLNPHKESELNPVLLDNIEKGANKLLYHLNKNNNILFVVDCDCDGFTSSALVWNYIKHFYPDANLSYICHEHKAHGFEDIMGELIDSSAQLIMEIDAGSSEKELHQIIRNHNKDIITIDHHILLEPDEYTILINNQSSDKYENKTLCGAGVAYKFCQYLDTQLNSNYSKELLDLCAVALIGDVMSFKHPETRFYVVEGLKNIKNFGLQSLINQQSFSLFKGNNHDLTPIGVAFYIVPLINAVVRAGTMDEKRLLFKMFIDGEQKIQSTKRGAVVGEKVTIGEEMARIASNVRARQNRVKDKATNLIDMKILKEDLLNNKIIIVEIEPEYDIPQELTGLICQQILSKYHRPTIIVRATSDGYLRGSTRGSDNFDEVPDFRQFLLDSGLMEYVAGHANANGCSFLIKDKDKLLNYANTHISDEGLDNSYIVDYIFNANEQLSKLIITIADNNYIFGNDINEPTAVVENIIVQPEQIQFMGENKDSIKFVYNNIEYVHFKDDIFAEQMAMINEPVIMKVYGRFAKNTWMGRTTAQFIIDDCEFDIINPEDF